MMSIFSSDLTLSYIVGRIFYPVWMCFGLLLFCFRLQRRPYFVYKTIAFVLLTYMASFFIPINTPYVPVNAIGILLCIFLYLRFAFRLSTKTSIFDAVSVVLLQNLSWNFSIALELTFIKDDVPGIVRSFPLLRWDTGLIFVCSCLLSYGLCYFFFIRPLKEQSNSDIKNYKLVIYAVLILVVAYGISDALNSFKIDNTAFLRYILSITCFSLFACLYSSSMADKLAMEKKIMDSLFQKEQKNYENLQMNIETMNKRAHDLKYELMALEKGDRKNPKAINELKSSLSLYERSPKTGNVALDNTLNEKMVFCENQNILFLYRVDGSPLSFMDSLDVYVLFGNALDNAMECVMKYEEKERRLITMNSYQKGNLLKFHIENPCFEGIEFEKGVPTTKKKETFFHGYGSKSMREIVLKYGGTIHFEKKDNLFSVDILFILKEPNS